MVLKKLGDFFRSVACLVVDQLPLFLMLVVFMTVPSFFSGLPYFKAYGLNVIPQAILPALILCWLASLHRCVWWLIFTIANFAFMIELGCLFCQQWRFNSTFASLILQTDTGETLEFIQMYYIPIIEAVLSSIVIGLLVGIGNFYWQRKSASLFVIRRFRELPMTSGLIGIIIVASVVYSPMQMMDAIKKHEARWTRVGNIMFVASTPVAYYYAFMDIFNNSDMRDFEQLAKVSESLTVDTLGVKNSLNVVYVVGESFPRSKSSLFGYYKETNPNMANELADSLLILFDNVISHANHTFEVYPTMLSTNEIYAPIPYVNYPLLPTIFKKSGFTVGYYDNQSLLKESTKFDYSCTYFFSNRAICKCSIDLLNDRRYKLDGELVEENPPLTDFARSLTIYHLMGQHSPASQRYPSSFSGYTDTDYDGIGYKDFQTQIVAEYDNATLYNDFVLKQIIDPLRDKVAIMVYSPDHGEEIYDSRDHFGRDVAVTIETARVFCEVPVWIWVSDKFKELYPEQVDALRRNVHKALYNGDLPHTIIDIAGIKTDAFRPELSLLNDSPGRTDRVIEGNLEYDANRDKINSYKMRYEK